MVQMTTSERIREVLPKLRTTSMPLKDLIPLLQKAADELDELHHSTSKQASNQSAVDEFNRVIQHAITLRYEAFQFLQCWNEGNWEGCREFEFEPKLEQP